MTASEHQALYAAACELAALLYVLAAFVAAGIEHRRLP